MSCKSIFRRNTIHKLSNAALLNIATGSGVARMGRQRFETNGHKCFIPCVFSVLENVILWVNIDYNRYSYFKCYDVLKILHLIDWINMFKLVI